MKSTQSRRYGAPWPTEVLAALSLHTAASLVDAVAAVSAADVAACDAGGAGVAPSVPRRTAARRPHQGWPERRTGSPSERSLPRRGLPAAAWRPSPAEGTWASRRCGCSRQQPGGWRRRHPEGPSSSPLTWSSAEEVPRRRQSSTASRRPARRQRSASARSRLPRTPAAAAASRPAGSSAGAAEPSARPRGRTAPPSCPAAPRPDCKAGVPCGSARRGGVAGAAAVVAAVERGCRRRRRWCWAGWTSGRRSPSRRSGPSCAGVLEAAVPSPPSRRTRPGLTQPVLAGDVAVRRMTWMSGC